MTLKPSEILQVDAMVITGVLILLTVSGAQFSNEATLGKISAITSLLIILPFSLSALMIARLELKRSGKEPVSEEFEKKQLRFGIKYMVAGFIYLLISLSGYVMYVIQR